MGKISKWQEQFIEEVNHLDNRDFFERFLEEIIPDNYGEFTAKGAWRAEYMTRRLLEKLIDAGWIKQSEAEQNKLKREEKLP